MITAYLGTSISTSVYITLDLVVEQRCFFHSMLYKDTSVTKLFFCTYLHLCSHTCVFDALYNSSYTVGGGGVVGVAFYLSFWVFFVCFTFFYNVCTH